MKALRIRGGRRTLAVIPALGLAAFLGFQAIAWACVGPSQGQTTASPTSVDPGDTVMVGATNVGLASTGYRVIFSTSSMDCHHGSTVLGGTTNSDANRNISPVPRVIPTNATSGVRYLCWRSVNGQDNVAPVAITIF